MSHTEPNRRSWSSRLLPWASRLVFALSIISIALVLLDIALVTSSGSSNLAIVIPGNSWTLDTSLSALEQLGWSPRALSLTYTVIEWLAAMSYFAVGLVVFFRKRDNWFGLYVAFTFAVLGTSGGLTSEEISGVAPVVAVWKDVTILLAWQFTLVLFYLFPDGRFVPAWTRWLVAGWVGANVFWFLTPSLTAAVNPFLVALVFSTMVSQIFRYFRRSDAIQRQQTKWIAFMVGILIIIFTLFYLAFTFVGPNETNLGPAFAIITSVAILMNLWLLLFPVVVTIAILKYRLWEIDIIIRRTLVYVPLTAMLAGVLAASAKLTQTILTAANGQQSDAATVLTTLIVVAAFDPLKKWLQHWVDALFKEGHDPRERWKAYGEKVDTFLDMFDFEAIAPRLLSESLAAFDASDGAVYLERAGDLVLVHTVGDHNNPPAITVPLEYDGRRRGSLELGKRRAGRVYDGHDRESLAQTANAVAKAIALTMHQSRNT